ncbi:hypothetical protein GCM10023238_00270 [Streptomyces heliomycini]
MSTASGESRRAEKRAEKGAIIPRAPVNHGTTVRPSAVRERADTGPVGVRKVDDSWERSLLSDARPLSVGRTAYQVPADALTVGCRGSLVTRRRL